MAGVQVKDVAEHPLAKQGSGTRSDNSSGNMETRLLENSINKICSLLAIGFGDAGGQVRAALEHVPCLLPATLLLSCQYVILWNVNCLLIVQHSMHGSRAPTVSAACITPSQLLVCHLVGHDLPTYCAAVNACGGA